MVWFPPAWFTHREQLERHLSKKPLVVRAVMNAMCIAWNSIVDYPQLFSLNIDLGKQPRAKLLDGLDVGVSVAQLLEKRTHDQHLQILFEVLCVEKLSFGVKDLQNAGFYGE